MEEIEKYELVVGGLKTYARIIGNKGGSKVYELVLPKLETSTNALLDQIKTQLIMKVKVTTAEMLNPKIIGVLKDKFKTEANDMLKEKLPNIKDNVREYLVGMLLNEMLGLEKIEFLLEDPGLEEIVITSSSEPIMIYHKRHGWIATNIFVKSDAQIHNYATIIARRVGRQVTALNPLLDAHLVTGDRANAVLYPISSKGHTITIRKFARDPWTVVDLINNGTCTKEIFAIIWLAMQYEMNVIISGGTASGKTSMLNACLLFMPPNHRILTIEDTRELQLAKHLYWCPLITRQPNPEGKGEVSMLDLLINSLRMRPDRIILGEMRKKDQAEVLFEAMHTGHSVYATVHADTVGETIKRLTNPPLSVPPNLLSAVNLNIVMFRDRRIGARRTLQIGEFIIGEEDNKTTVKPNIIYRWRPDNDKIVAHSASLRLFEELSRFTGMTQKDIEADLLKRQTILTWMQKYKWRSIEQVGKIMKRFYLDEEYIVNGAKKDINPDKLKFE